MGIASTRMANRFEDAFVYEIGERRTEIVMSHLPGESTSLILTCWPASSHGENDAEPLVWMEFRGEELRERLAFFQALRDKGILGHDGLLAIA